MQRYRRVCHLNNLQLRTRLVINADLDLIVPWKVTSNKHPALMAQRHIRCHKAITPDQRFNQTVKVQPQQCFRLAPRISGPASLVIYIDANRRCVVVQFILKIVVNKRTHTKGDFILLQREYQLLNWVVGTLSILLNNLESLVLDNTGQLTNSCQLGSEQGFTVTRENGAILTSRLGIDRIATTAIDGFYTE